MISMPPRPAASRIAAPIRVARGPATRARRPADRLAAPTATVAGAKARPVIRTE